MTSNQRIDEFLKLQNKGISLDEIASTLGIKPQTLKRDLNKNGYKSVKGKYIKKDEKSQNVSIQVSFVDNELNQKNNEKKAKKTTPKKTKVAEQNNKNEKVKVKNTKTSKTKKDKKINLTQEDLDKLCEVYDWYLEIKDCKYLKPKKTKKEIVVDFEKTEDKTVSMKVDKGVWEDFLRLCSNTSHDRKTLLTQALSDFMKVHKDLL
ncbi:DNA-binding protein [Intestinibacter bartlettii]|uniref:DNA-binding protein n=2 Tax=Intestinibacter bartlettii TaxID=261299 RepID=UPI001D0068AB|nr:DNA-binding protein [Intestinibacter bartlettii]MCB5744771.1 DNA-binding protein [Intestinibacter bartlettii]MDU1252772.1 DNA-binding protein [Peptostreptococcaceae bacterium]MDU2693405.1 DNA-binding protein [Intestinibacter bartlettii]MDU6197780.1 DNA-binding protein [Intestinibacter bartlettii]